MLFYVLLFDEYDKKAAHPWRRAIERWFMAFFATVATWVALGVLIMLFVLMAS